MPDTPAKILIVDDDEDITITISDYFNSQNMGIIPVATSDPRRVMSLLEEHRDVRLILSDFRMPGINGFELLMMVKAKYPHILFVMMTGYSTQELKREGFKRGAIRYIEKPFDLAELAEVIRDALQGSAGGFGGHIESIQLPDIIQLIGMSRRTVTLNITADQGKAALFFDDGEIIHAQSGELIGEEAFYEIFRWTGGRFTFSPLPPDTPQTVTQSWQGLLIEAARREDEAKAALHEASPEPPEQPEAFSLMEELEPAPPPPQPELETASAEVPAVESQTGFEPAPAPPPEPEPNLEPAAEEPFVAEAAPAQAASKTAADVILEVDEPVTEYPSAEVAEKRAAPELAPEAPVSPVTSEVPSEALKAPVAAQPALAPEVGGLTLEAIAREAWTRLSALWPSDQDRLRFGDIQMKGLPEYLRRHFYYRFEQTLRGILRLDGAPFDFEAPQVIQALEALYRNLMSQWLVSREMFQETLKSALSFEIGRCADPAAFLADFLSRRTDRIAAREADLLDELIGHSLVEDFWAPLGEDLRRHGQRRIHPRQLEYLGRALLYRRDEDEGYAAMRKAAARLLELAGGSDQDRCTLHPDTAILMLESHGLVQTADYLRGELKQNRKDLGIDDLDTMMERYRKFSGTGA